MSRFDEAPPTERRCAAAVAAVIDPRPRDLGGFEIRRVLPATEHRAVGPFVFFDHIGPATFAPGQGVDVRPHPHIGLATLTYLFEGEILHRDSLGNAAPIRPGAVNWMTAGRGIAHSERTPQELRGGGARLFGIQSWVALPRALEETDPAFFHHPADTLPELKRDGAVLRLIAGAAFGARAPVETLSEMFYVDAALDAGASLAVPEEHAERAVHVVEGMVEIGDERIEPGRMAVLAPDATASVVARAASRVILLGGAPLDGERHLWWNFVSSRTERIEQAKRDWKEGRFPPVPSDEEFIPLPES